MTLRLYSVINCWWHEWISSVTAFIKICHFFLPTLLYSFLSILSNLVFTWLKSFSIYQSSSEICQPKVRDHSWLASHLPRSTSGILWFQPGWITSSSLSCLYYWLELSTKSISRLHGHRTGPHFYHNRTYFNKLQSMEHKGEWLICTTLWLGPQKYPMRILAGFFPFSQHDANEYGKLGS